MTPLELIHSKIAEGLRDTPSGHWDPGRGHSGEPEQTPGMTDQDGARIPGEREVVSSHGDKELARVHTSGRDSPRVVHSGRDSPRVITGRDSPRVHTERERESRLHGGGRDSPRMLPGRDSPRVHGTPEAGRGHGELEPRGYQPGRDSPHPPSSHSEKDPARPQSQIKSLNERDVAGANVTEKDTGKVSSGEQALNLAQFAAANPSSHGTVDSKLPGKGGLAEAARAQFEPGLSGAMPAQSSSSPKPAGGREVFPASSSSTQPAAEPDQDEAGWKTSPSAIRRMSPASMIPMGDQPESSTGGVASAPSSTHGLSAAQPTTTMGGGGGGGPMKKRLISQKKTSVVSSNIRPPVTGGVEVRKASPTSSSKKGPRSEYDFPDSPEDEPEKKPPSSYMALSSTTRSPRRNVVESSDSRGPAQKAPTSLSVVESSDDSQPQGSGDSDNRVTSLSKEDAQGGEYGETTSRGAHLGHKVVNVAESSSGESALPGDASGSRPSSSVQAAKERDLDDSSNMSIDSTHSDRMVIDESDKIDSSSGSTVTSPVTSRSSRARTADQDSVSPDSADAVTQSKSSDAGLVSTSQRPRTSRTLDPSFGVSEISTSSHAQSSSDLQRSPFPSRPSSHPSSSAGFGPGQPAVSSHNFTSRDPEPAPLLSSQYETLSDDDD